MVGGVGTTCASLIQGTTEPPAGGATAVGGLIVYVYTQSTVEPVQSVYVQVYVFGPKQEGSGPMTGPVIVSGSPHELLTTGGVGTFWASLIHATVEPPSTGIETVGGETV